MASKNNINSVFTDIANSIRAKKGTTNTIQPINMAEEIDGIPTGIDGVEYIDGSITLAESALVNTVNIDKVALTIDFSRDSYDHVINVNSADTSINVNNGQTDITNNESGVINLDNKGSLTIASNSGNVTAENLTAENIKEGVSILGKVGTFKGGSSGSTLKKLLDARKSARYLFYRYTGTNVDDLISYSDTENVTDMISMLDNCTKLQSIPQLNTSKVTTMNNMFYFCEKLQTIPQLDTSNVTSMGSMLYNCYNLQTIPQLNTSKVTNMRYMFYNCYKLVTIPQLDMINVTDDYEMFYKCLALTNLTLLNIKLNLTIGSGTLYGHLLTLDSLINTIMELWNYKGSSSTYKLTMGSANLEKIANTYVLVTDETTDKMTAEVCDSTTEGAITLQAFAELKGWALQ